MWRLFRKASENAEEEGGLEEVVWRETALSNYRRQGPQASITEHQQAEGNRTGTYAATIHLRCAFLTSQCCHTSLQTPECTAVWKALADNLKQKVPADKAGKKSYLKQRRAVGKHLSTVRVVFR
eukprot:COSAG02_NODE_1937_length_10314_cov_5.665884_7_plen_124_part_00